MFLNGWENCSSTDTTLILWWTTQLVSLHISFEKGVSSSEDVPAETAGDTASEPQFTDEHAPEDASEPSAKGLPGTKKDVPPKAVSDGKLVKGMLARLLGVKIFVGLYVRKKKKQRGRGRVRKWISWCRKYFQWKHQKRTELGNLIFHISYQTIKYLWSDRINCFVQSWRLSTVTPVESYFCRFKLSS